MKLIWGQMLSNNPTMASLSPLTGVVLVDCARANAKEGVAIAAERCGYGSDAAGFQSALKSACDEMNVTVDDLSDLLESEQAQGQRPVGTEVSPDSINDL